MLDPGCLSVYTQLPFFDPARCILSSGSRLRPRKVQLSPAGSPPKQVKGLGPVGTQHRFSFLVLARRADRLQSLYRIHGGFDLAFPTFDEHIPVQLDPLGEQREFLRVKMTTRDVDRLPDCNLHRV